MAGHVLSASRRALGGHAAARRGESAARGVARKAAIHSALPAAAVGAWRGDGEDGIAAPRRAWGLMQQSPSMPSAGTDGPCPRRWGAGNGYKLLKQARMRAPGRDESARICFAVSLMAHGARAMPRPGRVGGRRRSAHPGGAAQDDRPAGGVRRARRPAAAAGEAAALGGSQAPTFGTCDPTFGICVSLP